MEVNMLCLGRVYVKAQSDLSKTGEVDAQGDLSSCCQLTGVILNSPWVPILS